MKEHRIRYLKDKTWQIKYWKHAHMGDLYIYVARTFYKRQF